MSIHPLTLLDVDRTGFDDHVLTAGIDGQIGDALDQHGILAHFDAVAEFVGDAQGLAAVGIIHDDDMATGRANDPLHRRRYVRFTGNRALGIPDSQPYRRARIAVLESHPDKIAYIR